MRSPMVRRGLGLSIPGVATMGRRMVGVAGSATVVQNGGGNKTLVLPTGIAANDLILTVASFGFNDAGTITEPSGFALLGTLQVSSFYKAGVYYKWAAGTESGANAQWGVTNNATRFSAACVVYRGLDHTSTPDVAAAVYSVTANTIASPASITSTHTPRVVFWAACLEYVVGTNHATITAPSGTTIRANASGVANANGAAWATGDTDSLTSPGNWGLAVNAGYRGAAFGVSAKLAA